MSTLSRRSLGLMAFGALSASALPVLAQMAPAMPAAKNRALFQVTENDPARWNIILRNMQNLKEGVGTESVEIELVAYGPGILMLKGDSAVKQGISEAAKNGVTILACQNTMKGMKLMPSDMLTEISYTPAGVVEVMRKQQQGWAYIRT